MVTYTNSFEENFEQFWKIYPKKVSRKNSYNKFKKVTDLQNLFEWLEKYIEKWTIEKTDLKRIPNPDTFLNQERYYDEIIIDKTNIKKNDEKRQEIKKQIEEKKQENESKEFKIILRNFFDSLQDFKKEELKYLAKNEIKIRFPKLIEWTSMYKITYETLIRIELKKLYVNRLELCTQWQLHQKSFL